MNLRRNQDYIDKFGANLRQIRETQGLSQTELAIKAEIQRFQVGRIERGEISTTITTVKAIADVLKMKVPELFNFE